MLSPGQDGEASKLLLDFLREEFTRRQLPKRLWRQLEKQYGDHLYSELLYFLTQMHFQPPEAREHWQRIQDHRVELERITGRDLGLRVALADYFINVRPTVDNPIIVEISLFLKKEETALRDELTGLYNRRFFNRILQQEIERARRFEQPVSLMMMDVDHFKAFNDCYGHPAGDEALVELAQVLRATCRTIDHLTRYGGEEFALVLPRSDRRQAQIASERLRRAIEKHAFLGMDDRRLTVSIGTSTFPVDATDGLQLLEKADQAMYEAKSTGRNRIAAFMIEKRLHPRYDVEMGMAIREAGNGREYLPGRTKNLSLGGLLGVTEHEVTAGADLEFRLWPRKEDVDLNLRGQCLRVTSDPAKEKTYYLGVRFDLDSMVQETALQTMIANHTDKTH
ncbi:MAG: diguanylate cyclase [Thermodesulfobacteriota bacterium]